MKKSILTILGVMFIMTLLFSPAIADPWETYRNTAYSRSDVVIGPTFDFTTSATGTATFTNGLTVPSGKSISANNAYYSGWLRAAGTTGLNYTTVTDLRASDDIYAVHLMAATTNLNATTMTNGYASGTFGAAGITGLNYTTMTDARVADDLYAHLMAATTNLNATTMTSLGVTNAATIGGTATAEDLVVNNTSNLKSPIYYDVYECTTNTTISDSSIYRTYVIGNTSDTQVMTLPTAAAAIGMKQEFIVNVDPGLHEVRVIPSGSETINGNASFVSSVQYAVLEVYSNGTTWFVTKNTGPWT